MIGRPQGRKAMYRASLFSRFAKWAASPVKVMGTRIFRRKGIISWKCVSRDHTQCLSGDISEHVFSVFPINSTCFGTFTGVASAPYNLFIPLFIPLFNPGYRYPLPLRGRGRNKVRNAPEVHLHSRCVARRAPALHALSLAQTTPSGTISQPAN